MCTLRTPKRVGRARRLMNPVWDELSLSLHSYDKHNVWYKSESKKIEYINLCREFTPEGEWTVEIHIKGVEAPYIIDCVQDEVLGWTIYKHLQYII